MQSITSKIEIDHRLPIDYTLYIREIGKFKHIMYLQCNKRCNQLWGFLEKLAWQSKTLGPLLISIYTPIPRKGLQFALKLLQFWYCYWIEPNTNVLEWFPTTSLHSCLSDDVYSTVFSPSLLCPRSSGRWNRTNWQLKKPHDVLQCKPIYMHDVYTDAFFFHFRWQKINIAVEKTTILLHKN